MAKPAIRPDQARDLLRRWEDPVAFARDVWGIDLWEAPPEGKRHAPGGQADIVRTYGHRASAVKSGRKTGKSTAAVIRGVHWMVVKARPSVCLTAPTFPQVEGILWKEFVRLYRCSRVPLGGRLYDSPGKGWVTNRGTLFGRTSDKPENLQGQSGSDQLVLVDEASGYRDTLLNALLGNLAGGGELVMLFNPTQPSGLTYDAFHSKSHMFCRVDLSSLDTPNMTGLGTKVPGLMDPSSLELLRGIWGEHTPAWDCHVEGRYPGQGVNTIVGLALVERAKVLRHEIEFTGPLTVGIDVARFGDDRSVVFYRRGLRIALVLVLRGVDGVELAGAALEALDRLRRPAEPAAVNVDASGNASCADQLHAVSEARNIHVWDVMGGSSPTEIPSYGPGYHDLNAQLWFGARKWLSEGGSLPTEEDALEWARQGITHAATPQDLEMLSGELTGRIFDFDRDAKYQVESKKTFKARIKRSPDLADAFVYCLWEPPLPAQGERRAKRSSRLQRGGY